MGFFVLHIQSLDIEIRDDVARVQIKGEHLQFQEFVAFQGTILGTDTEIPGLVEGVFLGFGSVFFLSFFFFGGCFHRFQSVFLDTVKLHGMLQLIRVNIENRANHSMTSVEFLRESLSLQIAEFLLGLFELVQGGSLLEHGVITVGFLNET